MSIDSRVTLALMAKAKLVFEQPDTLLSFPVPPFAFSTSEMRAAAGELSDANDMSAAFEFARLVNQCPTIPIWTSASDEMLWSVCDDVLNRTGQVARIEQTASDEAAFRAAEQVLFIVDDQGLRTPSPRAKLYAQYRDTWFTLQHAYRARKVAAETATADETVRAAWAHDEATLRAEIETLERDWRGLGYRSEVEAAHATMDMLASRGPSLQWDRWTQNFRSFLDSRTDTVSEARFCPTTYTPANVVDSSGWIDFHISGAEFETLINGAPAELRARLDPSGTGPAVSSVSFASTTVGVTRPWIDIMRIFRAKFWRFADASRYLSDGSSPPRGEWPAYVAGLVLARNVVVEAQPLPPEQPSPRPRAGFVWVPATATVPGHFERERAGAQPQHRVGGDVGARVRAVVPPVAVGLAGVRRIQMSTERRRVATPSAQAMVVLRANQVPRLEYPAVAEWSGPRATLAPAADEVFILAFICRWLPKCPNPDPGLFPS